MKKFNFLVKCLKICIFIGRKTKIFCDVNYQKKVELYLFGFEVMGNSLEVIFTKKTRFLLSFGQKMLVITVDLKNTFEK